MAPVIATLVAGLVVGVIVTALAWRWPSGVASPAVPPSVIRHEVERHPTLASVARARLDPAAATGLALTVAALIAAAGAVAVGVLLFMVRQEIGFARWDLSAASWGARHATEASSDLLRAISMLGGTAGIVVVTVIAAVIEHRRMPHRAVVLFLVVTVVGQNLLANGTKLLVDRARPDLSQLTGFAGSSFPSGHTTAAAATYAAIALLVGRGRRPEQRALLAGGAAAIAGAVGATRILLGVHWLTDVLAGLALGWAWFALCSIAFGGRLLVFGAPVITAERIAERDAGNGAADRGVRPS